MDDTFIRSLGKAVVAQWGSLPRDVQEAIFEAAAREAGKANREALATFLHAHHPRTQEQSLH